MPGSGEVRSGDKRVANIDTWRVIDLGEMRHEADRPDPDWPEAGGPATGRFRTGRADRTGPGDRWGPGAGWLLWAGGRGGAAPIAPRHRFGATLAVLAAVAALLTGAAAPQRSALGEARLEAAIGDAFRVIGDQVYLSRPDLTVQRRPPRVVATYLLPEGRLRWRASLTIRGVLRKAVTVPSATLVSMEGLDGVETVAIDAASSQIRWRRPYLLVDVLPERNLALVSGSAPGRRALTALDATTGRTVWEYAAPDGTWHFLEQEWIVSALPSGRVEVHEPDRGALVAVAQLGTAIRPSLQSWAQPAGGLLLVGTGDSTVTAYGLPWLDLRWRARWDLTDWSVSPTCGEALCVFNRTDGLRVVDRATGRTKWSDPQWISAELAAGDRLLVRGRQRPGGTSAAALVDAATGRELLDLRRWTAVGRPGERGGALLAVQIDRENGRAWFGSVDPSSLTVQVIDWADGVGTACQPGPDSLICRRRDFSVSVWRLNRP